MDDVMASTAEPEVKVVKRNALDKKVKSLVDLNKPPKNPRPRTKSDKLDRSVKKKAVVDVTRASAFDWPLGRIGKLKQKYKAKDKLSEMGKAPKGRSVSAVTLSLKEAEKVEVPKRHNLKRHHSERKGKTGGRSVAFEDTSGGLAASLWSASVKFFTDKGKGGKKTGRRRHYTDPDSSTTSNLEAVIRFADHLTNLSLFLSSLQCTVVTPGRITSSTAAEPRPSRPRTEGRTSRLTPTSRHVSSDRLVG